MKELRIPASVDKTKKTSLNVNIETAAIVRRIALAEGRGKNLSSLIYDMAVAYVAAKHPDWAIEEA